MRSAENSPGGTEQQPPPPGPAASLDSGASVDSTNSDHPKNALNPSVPADPFDSADPADPIASSKPPRPPTLLLVPKRTPLVPLAARKRPGPRPASSPPRPPLSHVGAHPHSDPPIPVAFALSASSHASAAPAPAPRKRSRRAVDPSQRTLSFAGTALVTTSQHRMSSPDPANLPSESCDLTNSPATDPLIIADSDFIDVDRESADDGDATGRLGSNSASPPKQSTVTDADRGRTKSIRALLVQPPQKTALPSSPLNAPDAPLHYQPSVPVQLDEVILPTQLQTGASGKSRPRSRAAALAANTKIKATLVDLIKLKEQPVETCNTDDDDDVVVVIDDTPAKLQKDTAVINLEPDAHTIAISTDVAGGASGSKVTDRPRKQSQKTSADSPLKSQLHLPKQQHQKPLSLTRSNPDQSYPKSDNDCADNTINLTNDSSNDTTTAPIYDLVNIPDFFLSAEGRREKRLLEGRLKLRRDVDESRRAAQDLLRGKESHPFFSMNRQISHAAGIAGTAADIPRSATQPSLVTDRVDTVQTAPVVMDAPWPNRECVHVGFGDAIRLDTPKSLPWPRIHSNSGNDNVSQERCVAFFTARSALLNPVVTTTTDAAVSTAVILNGATTRKTMLLSEALERSRSAYKLSGIHSSAHDRLFTILEQRVQGSSTTVSKALSRGDLDWARKYEPVHTSQVLGDESVKVACDLAEWLLNWRPSRHAINDGFGNEGDEGSLMCQPGSRKRVKGATSKHRRMRGGRNGGDSGVDTDDDEESDADLDSFDDDDDFLPGRSTKRPRSSRLARGGAAEKKRRQQHRRRIHDDLSDFIDDDEDDGDDEGATGATAASKTAGGGAIDADTDDADVRSLVTQDNDDDATLYRIVQGPLGCGKSSLVHAAAATVGFNVIELHTGHRRSGRDVLAMLGEAAQSHSVRSRDDIDTVATSVTDTVNLTETSTQPRPSAPRSRPSQTLLLIEDVNVLFEPDRGFWSGVATLCETSKTPIVLTCVDLPFQPTNTALTSSLLATLDSLFTTMTMQAPSTLQLAWYLHLIALCEGVYIEMDVLVAWCERSRARLSVRQSIMSLQTWAMQHTPTTVLPNAEHVVVVLDRLGPTVSDHDDTASSLHTASLLSSISMMSTTTMGITRQAWDAALSNTNDMTKFKAYEIVKLHAHAVDRLTHLDCLSRGVCQRNMVGDDMDKGGGCYCYYYADDRDDVGAVIHQDNHGVNDVGDDGDQAASCFMCELDPVTTDPPVVLPRRHMSGVPLSDMFKISIAEGRLRAIFRKQNRDKKRDEGGSLSDDDDFELGSPRRSLRRQPMRRATVAARSISVSD